jgi:hypothetical protein
MLAVCTAGACATGVCAGNTVVEVVICCGTDDTAGVDGGVHPGGGSKALFGLAGRTGAEATTGGGAGGGGGVATVSWTGGTGGAATVS